MFYAEYRADEGGFYGKHRDSFVGTDEIWDRKLSMTMRSFQTLTNTKVAILYFMTIC